MRIAGLSLVVTGPFIRQQGYTMTEPPRDKVEILRMQVALTQRVGDMLRKIKKRKEKTGPLTKEGVS